MYSPSFRPGETKRVDVAVRLKGDNSSYIHTPENFEDKFYRLKACELTPCVYAVKTYLECDGGRTDEYLFIIVTEAGTYPDLVRLEAT